MKCYHTFYATKSHHLDDKTINVLYIMSTLYLILIRGILFLVPVELVSIFNFDNFAVGPTFLFENMD